MRKIIVSEFVSLDGVFEAPGPDGSDYKHQGWTFKFSGDDIMKFKYDELMAADTQLLGRVTYEGFAKAWPHMEGTGEFGEKMNGMQKYVVSKTLKKADWQNSKIIHKDVAKEVARIKKDEGGDILVAGSGKLVNFLLQEKLVDEIRLVVYPIILGSGKKLFDEKSYSILTLLESTTFKSGVTALRYEPKL